MSLDTRKAFRDLRATDSPELGDLATKADLHAEVTICKAELHADIARLEVKMAKQENRLIVWIAGAAAFSAFANGGFQFLGKLLRLG